MMPLLHRRQPVQATPDGRMSLRAHLSELRRRATVSAIAIALCSVVAFAFSDVVISAAAAPLKELDNQVSSINFTTLSGAFDLRLRVAIALGVVAASPVWLFHTWRFLVPGLSARERRYGRMFVGSVLPLFLAGGAFGWWIMPNLVIMMAGFAPPGSSTLINANEYFDFLFRLIIAVGLGFASPVALVILNAYGLLPASALLKSWRGAIVAIVVFAAVVTPPSDMLSLALIAFPLIGLYFAAWGVCAIHDRRARRALAPLDRTGA